MPRFDAQTIVRDALSLHPSARWVFAAYHLSGCRGCERSDHETLAELADGYRIPLERFLADLNSLLERPA
ncbi:MAG: disulfide oxidoreductase [Acidobacteria bacterium]|nr:disulfide oxidoreductase [Acidobacteriota bacterium]MBV9477189.1 disulfide oxidoreductase [Acidobacteriota bacterium]